VVKNGWKTPQLSLRRGSPWNVALFLLQCYDTADWRTGRASSP